MSGNIEELKQAAERGDAKAQYDLAIHYRNGYDVPNWHKYSDDKNEVPPENAAKAFPWFLKSAENGYTNAKYSVAVCYLRGIGTKENEDKGHHWLQKAVDDENVDAILYHVRYWTNRFGYLSDESEELLKKAARMGNVDAKECIKDLKGTNSNWTLPCYVATCVYGSYNAPEVWTLRRWRDSNLSESWFGKRFIQIYYATSPTIVKWFGSHRWFNKLCKPILDKLVRKLQRDGM